MLLRSKILLAFLLLFGSLAAQTEREQQALNLIETRIEYLMQAYEESDLDFTTLFDDLYLYYQNPLNLNEASREELSQTYLFNDYQITQLMIYREKYGDLKSIYELQLIDGFDPQSIAMFLPFVEVSPVKTQNNVRLGRAFKYGRSELILRHQRVFPDAFGYSRAPDSVIAENPNARYLGSPDRLYARYRFQYNKQISIGITGEKDPGEEFFQGSQPHGFDFYSAHLFLRDMGPVKKLAIGDYHLQMGQGLTFWSGFGFRKSPSQTVDVKRYAQNIRPYTGSDENNFMRGVAGTIGLGAFDITLFYSNKRVDGNLQFVEDTTDADQVGSFSSLQSTGLHRTPSELEDKNSVHEVVYGGTIDYRWKKGKIGFAAVRSAFDPSLERDLQYYQYHEFEGSHNTNAGLNYELSLNKFNMFGETALSENGGFATLNGAIMNLDSRFKASVVQRYYSKDYQSLYADGFGEKSGARNEAGVYFGTEFLPVKFISVAAFYDMYSFPWLSYQVDRPGKGNEFSGQITFRPLRKLEFIFLFRNESAERNNNPENNAINPVGLETRRRYRAQMTATLTKNVSLRTRVERADFEREGEASRNGILVYQDLYLDFLDSKLAFKLRYAIFNTPDYDTRIYAYENDLRYQFFVPAYYRKGTRVYGVVRWKVTDFMTFNFKWSQTFLADEDHFGDGKDRIDSDTRSEIKTQLIFKF